MDAPHIWTVEKCIQNNYYCIVYNKYSSVIDEATFKFMKYLISISKTRPFENDIILIS